MTVLIFDGVKRMCQDRQVAQNFSWLRKYLVFKQLIVFTGKNTCLQSYDAGIPWLDISVITNDLVSS